MWNGWRLSTSFQRLKTLFPSNFSRYSICFGAGRTKLGTGRNSQKSSPVRGSGKRPRVSHMSGKTIGLIWSRLLIFFLSVEVSSFIVEVKE